MLPNHSGTLVDEEAKTQWRVPEWFDYLSDIQLEQLRMFHVELISFNGRINLISPRSERNADIMHFADCISASEALLASTNESEIYDIGSGNGLPGIILAILDSTRKIVLIDKDARKIEFLKHVASKLNLKNVVPIHTRVEDLPDASIKCAISRGFASIGKSLVCCRKAAAEGMEYYHMKSDSWVTEAADIPPQICSYWQPQLVKQYSLPANLASMNLILTKRTA